MLSLSQRERDRLVILNQVEQGQLTVSEGARRARLGIRHFRRLLRRFESLGDQAVAHGLRGRASNRRLPEELREKALQKASNPLYQDFAPTLLSEHLARDPAIGAVNPHTLRRWMMQTGRWTPKQRRQQHRKRRERRAAPGELVLMDTSIHRWLEERSSEEIVLIALIDDATSRLYARFFPRDTGAANRQALAGYLQTRGRMGALYVDQASHFRANGSRRSREERDLQEGITIIQRGLAALEIEIIFALSPQAKGRVERLFGTLQDRLIKEMRIAGIASLGEANRFLEDVFLPFWNSRFTVEPREAVDAHRPLPAQADLLRLFAQTEQRVIRCDFTFRYKNQYFQIEMPEADPRMPTHRITIERRFDATTRFRWEEQYLQPTPIASPPQPIAVPTLQRAIPKPPTPRPAPADHPWRRSPILVGSALYGKGVGSAALRPDTPPPGGTASISP